MLAEFKACLARLEGQIVGLDGLEQVAEWPKDSEAHSRVQH